MNALEEFMPLEIEKIPFYNAVLLFEKEEYEKSLGLFLVCAKNGNLYAPFYLQAIQEKVQKGKF